MRLIQRIKSFKYAIAGLVYLFKSQANAQIHLVALFVVTSCGFYFNISHAEWLALVIVIALVIGSEIINTAIENICNLVEPNNNFKVKIIKDLAAAAVLINAIASVIVGLIIFLPKIFR